MLDLNQIAFDAIKNIQIKTGHPLEARIRSDCFKSGYLYRDKEVQQLTDQLTFLQSQYNLMQLGVMDTLAERKEMREKIDELKEELRDQITKEEVERVIEINKKLKADLDRAEKLYNELRLDFIRLEAEMDAKSL